jgi:serine/threonine protein kinase
MANVYKVWHEELEIVRAIKILKPGFNEESKQRLQTEAKISAHLHHPNIVEIFGVDFWNNTVPYLEMEFIDGFSLKDLLKHKKQLHFTFALSIGYFVCNALHYAHNQVFTLYGKPYHGVVHRDIKPANIMLARNGIIKLADFGIAKPSDISLHTVGQKVMGTFTYLSPEQLNGESLDCRCDIYSLGAVLYEIITGAKAFPQKTMAELVQKKMLNNYRPLSSFDVDMPKHLCSMIDKSMELNREKRYANASEFSADLLSLLQKITQKTPDFIVSEYIKNPDKVPALQLKKKINYPLVAIIAGCVAVVLAFTAMLISPDLERSVENIFVKKNAASSGFDQRAREERPLPEKPALAHSEQSAVQAVSDTLAALREVPEQATPGADENKPKNAAMPSGSFAANKALKTVRENRRKDAAHSPETGSTEEAGDSTKNNPVISLLERYLANGDTGRARRIAESHFVNDGYFYYLCGKIYFLTGDFNRAIDLLGKAQTTPSRFQPATKEEATYLWAKSLDEVYKLKPNSENKRACFRAWRQFSKAFCDEPADERSCADAAKRLSFFAE